MGRDYLAGQAGDATNAVLAAVGYDFRLLLVWLEELWCALLLLALIDDQASPPTPAAAQKRVLHRRPCVGIDEQVNIFLNRSLESEWLYHWFDATYVKVRQAGRIVSVTVIIAVAINDDGRREVLGMGVGASQAETF